MHKIFIGCLSFFIALSLYCGCFAFGSFKDKLFSLLLLIIILFFRNGLFGHKEVTWSSIGKRLSALSGHKEVAHHE